MVLPSACVLSRVHLFAAPWTTAHQAPLSMGFPRTLACIAICSSRASSPPRDRTRVPCTFCTSRWAHYHCAPWEAWPAANKTSNTSMYTRRLYIPKHVQLAFNILLELDSDFVTLWRYWNQYTHFTDGIIKTETESILAKVTKRISIHSTYKKFKSSLRHHSLLKRKEMYNIPWKP